MVSPPATIPSLSTSFSLVAMDSNPVSFRIVSINVNGLGDVRKRRLAFNYLRRFKRTIFLLQETHCPPGNGRLWRSQWGSSMFLTEESSRSGGIATLFSRDLDPSVIGVKVSRCHRFLITDFELQGEHYQLVNLYMPTSDKEKCQISTLKELFDSLDSDDNSHLFAGGDFNLARDADLDREGYAQAHITNTLFRVELDHFLERFDLGDVWRIQNPLKKQFTWSRSAKLARLDYLFAPLSFPGHVQAFHPKTCSFSDHRLITLEIRPTAKPKGLGFWKFKTSLLQRQDFCEEIIDTIEQTERDSVDLKPDTRWEFLKLKIREASIKFAKKLKEDQSALESEMQTRLWILEKDILSSPGTREEYHEIKRELYQVQLLKTRESMLRSRVRWVGEGERPTKYFLNLEKKQFDSKTISSIYNGEGILLEKTDQILDYEKTHFSHQYSVNQQNREALEGGGGSPFSPPKGISHLGFGQAVA